MGSFFPIIRTSQMRIMCQWRPRILAAQSPETFPEIVAEVGDALWSDDGARLDHLAEASGCAA